MAYGIEPEEVEFDQLAYYVDQCSRGIDRLRLIRSITEVPIHLFGGKCWREIKPIEDWSYYLSKQANVILHPPVNYEDSLYLMKQSKICLNSMPFFKNGTHERVFAALACGSLPLTSESLYLRENFIDGKEILFYQAEDLEGTNDKVRRYIENEAIRKEIVDAGRMKVKREHTWDNRVEAVLRP